MVINPPEGGATVFFRGNTTLEVLTFYRSVAYIKRRLVVKRSPEIDLSIAPEGRLEALFMKFYFKNNILVMLTFYRSVYLQGAIGGFFREVFFQKTPL
jgi:hypothetical protein